MSPATLKAYTCKDLAQMAKKRGVPGWHSMRKDQLVRAIVKAAKANGQGVAGRRAAGRIGASATASKKRRQLSKAGKAVEATPSRKPANPRVRQRINQLQSKLEQVKNLATASANGDVADSASDRLVVMVRDAYWLHCYWDLSPGTVQRARAALGQKWHAAKPVLRLLRECKDETTTILRTIDIHGGVNNWYIDVHDPPSRFRLEIGYLADDGTFQRMARSNPVTTPPKGVSKGLDEGWSDLAENADRIYALSGGYSPQGGCQELQELLEERVGRPMGSPMDIRFGAGARSPFHNMDDFDLAVDAALVVFGATRRDAHVTLQGEPVRVRADGTFTVRLDLPDRRQVIPVVASSIDGVEQRTISLAVERNTKVMEPVVRDTSA